MEIDYKKLWVTLRRNLYENMMKTQDNFMFKILNAIYNKMIEMEETEEGTND